jgi:hypothetical protein
MPIFFFNPRQVLGPGSQDPVLFNSRRNGTLDMEERIKVSLRENLAKDLQALFSSSHAGQPVMDQSHLKGRQGFSVRLNFPSQICFKHFGFKVQGLLTFILNSGF